MKRQFLHLFLLVGAVVFSNPATAQSLQWESLPDFSHAGYKGGGVPIPDDIPTVVVVSPIAGDDTFNIQSALDLVGEMPLQANGYRGAVQLVAGTYEVSAELRMLISGVVLRGESHMTTIINYDGETIQALLVGGADDDDWETQIQGTIQAITTPYIPLGSYSFAIGDATSYAVGDEIVVWHETESAWFESVDQGGVTEDTPWELQTNWKDVRYRRVITEIDGNVITVDAPMFMDLDSSLASLWMYKYDRPYYTTNMGIEDFTISIVTSSDIDETQARTAVYFRSTDDSWARRVTTKHFWGEGFRLSGTVNCTIEDCSAIEPHSTISASKRYNFSTSSAQLVLFKNCYAEGARHAYISNGHSYDSGIVFLDCEASSSYAASESHQRWATGILFDNLIFTVDSPQSPGQVLMLGNRGDHGNAHGWAAANSVAWRCDVSAIDNRIVVQNPPGSAQNYAIGCIGLVDGAFAFDGMIGHVEFPEQVVDWPRSLYEGQLGLRGSLSSDNLSPTVPSALVVALASDSSVDLNWNASSDDSGVVAYRIHRDGTAIETTVGTSSSNGGLFAERTYNYTVTAVDAAGNESVPSAVTSVTTEIDVELPTIPQLLSATPLNSYSADITWPPSTDNFEVAFYRIFQDGLEIDTSLVAGYTVFGIGAGTSHLYSVKAVDWSGNESEMSDVVLVETPLASEDPFLWVGLPFEEESGNIVVDVSPHANDGTLVAGTARVDAGYFGQAAEFDGNSGSIDLDNLDIPGSAMTIAAWIRPDDFGVGDARIVSKATSAAEDDHVWMLSTINDNGTKLRFRLRTFNSIHVRTLVGSITLSAGVWTHVAASYDGATMRLYVNGVLDTSFPHFGNVYEDPLIPVVIGDQPEGGRKFDGRIDDFRIYLRALGGPELIALMGSAVDSTGPPPSPIDIWYGDYQRFGHLGVPQSQINILGNVTNWAQIASLAFSLNGVPHGEISMGPEENIRLAHPGDFNVEIPFTDLNDGVNQVRVTATAFNGLEYSKDVVVDASIFNVWPRTYSVDWSEASSIDEVAQVVDGKWELVPGGVKVIESHYDRVIAIGDIEWNDYEVTVPITVHRFDPQPVPLEPLVGVMLRWDGHEKESSSEQPGTEWRPIGGMGVHGWYNEGSRGGHHFQIFETGSDKFAGYPGMTLPLETPYYFKFRVETPYEGSPGLYRFKVWPVGQAEPSEWGITHQNVGGLREGSLMLVAHYVEATFGDIVVTPFEPSTEPPPAPETNVVANGGFESGVNPWKFYTSGSGNATTISPGYEGSKAILLNINSAASNIQLYQNDIPLEPSTAYRLTFVAYSSTGSDLRISLNKHSSPYNSYGLNRKRVNLSTEWQTFTIEFTTTGFGSPVEDGRLYFWLASDASAGDRYYIDKVYLAPVSSVSEPDTEAPSVPSDLTASLSSDTAAQLTWSASTDDVGVSSYTVYRDGEEIGSSTTTSFLDQGLDPSSSFVYTVTAFDEAGNESSPSSGAGVETPAAGTPPSVPQNILVLGLSETQIGLSWDASTDDGVVTGYRVYRDGVHIGTSVTASFTDSGLEADSNYQYQVQAVDDDLNTSVLSGSVLGSSLPDTTLPSVPDGLEANGQSSTSIQVSWLASIDNYAMGGYRVKREGVQVAEVAGTSFLDTALSPDASHSYTVEAFDAAGNSSGFSGPAVGETFPDTPVPGPMLWLGMGFDETDGNIAFDISSNENNGTLTSGVTREASGYFGSSLRFSGSGGRVDLGNLDIPGAELTLACWIRADGFGTGAMDGRILSKATGVQGDQHYWMLSTINSGGIKPRFRLKTTNGGTATLIGTTVLQPDAWTHLAATYDGSVMKLFVNGIFAGSIAKSGQIVQAPTVPASVGDQPQGSRSFDGLIDDFRIYTDALDQSALAQVIENGLSELPDPDNEAPSVPSLLEASLASGTSAQIIWSASTDDVGVSDYTIYRNGAEIGSSTTTTFLDVGLSSSSSFIYTVTASDRAGNESALSNEGGVETPVTEMKVFDWNRPAKESHSGFPHDQPPLENGNWMSPVNFAEGTFHIRIEILSQPVPQSMIIQFCVWQEKDGYNFELETCTTQGSITGTPGEIVTISQDIESMWKKDGNPIEWDRARYRNGIAIKTSEGLPVSDFQEWDWNGEDPNEWYPLDLRYTVVVVAKGGAFSGWENYLNDGDPDTAAPSAPSGLASLLASDTAAQLTWNASTDDVGVSGYTVYRDLVEIGSSATTSFLDEGLEPSSSFVYTVTALDEAGNESSPSNETGVETPAASTPPSVPVNLQASGLSETQIGLSWDASTDDGLVDGYRVFRDGVFVGTSGTGSFTDSGLEADSTHQYQVQAVDDDLNTSSLSGSIPGSTLPDTTPPSIPGGLQANGQSTTSIQVSWSASTDNYAMGDYRVKRDGTQVAEVAGTSFLDTGLSPDANHSYTVEAFDAAGNPSGSSDPAVGTTLPDSPEPVPNAISNGGFETGLLPWKFYTNGSGSAVSTGPGYVGSGAAEIAINTAASNIQLYQSDISLEPNTNYRLTFAAYSSSGRDFRVSLNKHSSPYNNYGLNRVRAGLTTGWQMFTIEFTTKGFSSPVSNGRLYFWFASDAKAGDVYHIDEVVLTKQ